MWIALVFLFGVSAGAVIDHTNKDANQVVEKLVPTDE